MRNNNLVSKPRDLEIEVDGITTYLHEVVIESGVIIGIKDSNFDYYPLSSVKRHKDRKKIRDFMATNGSRYVYILKDEHAIFDNDSHCKVVEIKKDILKTKFRAVGTNGFKYEIDVNDTNYKIVLDMIANDKEVTKVIHGYYMYDKKEANNERFYKSSTYKRENY